MNNFFPCTEQKQEQRIDPNVSKVLNTKRNFVRTKDWLGLFPFHSRSKCNIVKNFQFYRQCVCCMLYGIRQVWIACQPVIVSFGLWFMMPITFMKFNKMALFSFITETLCQPLHKEFVFWCHFANVNCRTISPSPSWM